MIIDAHCHVGKGDLLTDPSDTSAPLKNYLIRAKKSGIDRTVLFPIFNSNYDTANYNLACIVKKWPKKFYGFAFIHPVLDKGKERILVKKFVQEFNLKGLKVHMHDGHITRAICEAANFFNLPILYDVMGNIAHVELIAQEFPNVNFIIPHLGSFGDDWKAQFFMIHLLERYPNLFSDTSGVRRFDLLTDCVKRAGAEKLIFGSDGPWLNPEVELFKIKAMKLPKGDEEKILGINILKLLNLV